MTEVFAVGEHKRPVLGPHHRVEFLGMMTAGIHAAHDTAHAGTGDDVDGDAGSLQHLQHSDMGHTLGTTATEHHRHLLAWMTGTVYGYGILTKAFLRKA